jgi:hypothetical protein
MQKREGIYMKPSAVAVTLMEEAPLLFGQVIKLSDSGSVTLNAGDTSEKLTLVRCLLLKSWLKFCSILSHTRLTPIKQSLPVFVRKSRF